MSEKRLHKSAKNKMVCGVCGGLAEYFKIDPTIVRLVFVLVALFKGVGVLAYVIAAIVMPFDSAADDEDDISNLKSANLDSDKTINNEGKGPHSEQDFNEYFKK